jgi:drug/metabolite transporter (DMT)-like permease
MFTYALSVVYLGYPVTTLRVLAVVVAFAGVVVVGMDRSHSNDGSSGEHAEALVSPAPSSSEKIVGVLLMLIAALGYAVYEVYFKVALTRRGIRENPRTVNLLLGVIGVFTLVVLGVGIPLLEAVPHDGLWGIGRWVHETAEWPDTAQAETLLLQGMLGLTFNLSFVHAVSITSPLIVSVACMATIPASAAVDAVMHGYIMGPASVAGSAMIVGGFGLLAWAEQGSAGTRQESGSAETKDRPSVDLDPAWLRERATDVEEALLRDR